MVNSYLEKIIRFNKLLDKILRGGFYLWYRNKQEVKNKTGKGENKARQRSKGKK